MASANEPGNGTDHRVDRAAFMTSCDKLGFDPRFAPARVDHDRSEDAIGDLAESLHAERRAALLLEDTLTAKEVDALRATLAGFKSNFAPMSDARTTLEQALKWVRLGCAIRHLPGVERPDALRQRWRSWALRPAGCRFDEIYNVAAANAAAFRPNVLARLAALKDWAARLRTHVSEVHAAAQEKVSRRGAI
jgi:hypothetical protein